MLEQIRGFRVEIDLLEAKGKQSQNRNPRHRVSAAGALEALHSADPNMDGSRSGLDRDPHGIAVSTRPVENIPESHQRNLIFAVRDRHSVLDGGRPFVALDDEFPIAAIRVAVPGIKNRTRVFNEGRPNHDRNTAPKSTFEIEFVQLVEDSVPDQRMSRVCGDPDPLFHLQLALRVQANESRRAGPKRRRRIIEVARL